MTVLIGRGDGGDPAILPPRPERCPGGAGIAYTPQVCLRLAQYETQYLSRKKALLQVAEAVQGFRILQAEGETDAADWLREAELLTDQLLADDKNA